jgi:DNA-binding protein HU-beta
MRKSELIKAVAENSFLSNKDASTSVNLVFEIITEELMAGRDVFVRGFGRFVSKENKASLGFDMRRRVTVPIAATKKPFLRPAKSLIKQMNSTTDKGT